MAKKPYKWITAERLLVLKEEFELYSTKRSVNKACQAVAKRLNVTSYAVYEAIKGLIKHYGHIPTLTPGYELIKKKKARKKRLPSKPKVLQTNCIKCSLFLTEQNRSLSRTRKSICKTCYNAYTREYRKKYQEKHNEIMKNWRSRNKDKVREMHLKYIIKNYGSLNEYTRNYNSDNIINLKDPYVKMLLSKDLSKDVRRNIPQDLIDLQRTKLLLIRKIKQSNV